MSISEIDGVLLSEYEDIHSRYVLTVFRLSGLIDSLSRTHISSVHLDESLIQLKEDHTNFQLVVSKISCALSSQEQS